MTPFKVLISKWFLDPMLDLRKPTVLATTAPWILGLDPTPMTASMREYLTALRDHKCVNMVKKYRDSQGRMRVVPGLYNECECFTFIFFPSCMSLIFI